MTRKRFNKQHTLFFFILFFIISVVVSLGHPLATLAAGDASFTLSPTSGSYHVNDTFTVAISETSTSGDNVNAVEADLTYNASQLQYQSTTLTGPFNICAKNSGGGGSVSIACAASSTQTGTQSVATITFKVLASGTATVSMSNTSDIDNTGGTSVFDGTFPTGSYSLAAATSSSGSSNSSGSSSNNSTGTPSCTAQAPSSAPNLYEVDVTSTTATVYFSPAESPYNSHFISYGQGNLSEGYGINFPTSQSQGALYYVVRQLSPSTVYTFKVRGGNGCKPGAWSGTLTILTLPRNSQYTKKYFATQQAPLIQSTLTSWWQQATNFVSDHLPGVPNTGLGAPKGHVKVTPETQSQGAPQQQHPTNNSGSSSIWGSVVDFFSNIFHSF